MDGRLGNRKINMCKKVGIATFHWAKNYGAVLQAYSLKNAVEKLGKTSYVLNHVSENDETQNYKFFTWGSKSAYLTNLFKMLFYKSFRESYKKFADFREQYLGIDTPIYRTSADIPQKLIDETFAFITGSDQVWHPRAYNDIYGLEFASAINKRTIAYAPSLRDVGMTDNIKQKMRNGISKIDYLSAREQSVADFVGKLVNREVPVVIDPVFLTTSEEWKKIAVSPKFNFDYILVYLLSRDVVLEKQIKIIAKKLQLPVVLVIGSNIKAIGMLKAKKYLFDCGPLDFIGLFANAKFICTNSFHGTAFACIFNKNFLAYRNGATDTRVSSLLTNLGLSENFIENGADVPSSCFGTNFDCANAKIQQMRDFAFNYLSRALE